MNQIRPERGPRPEHSAPLSAEQKAALNKKIASANAAYDAAMAERQAIQEKDAQRRQAVFADIDRDLQPFLPFLPQDMREGIRESLFYGLTRNYTTIISSSLTCWGVEYAPGFEATSTGVGDGCTNERCNCHSHDSYADYFRIHQNPETAAQQTEGFFRIDYEHHNRTLRVPGSQDGTTEVYLHVNLLTQQVCILTVDSYTARHESVSVESLESYQAKQRAEKEEQARLDKEYHEAWKTEEQARQQEWYEQEAERERLLALEEEQR